MKKLTITIGIILIFGHLLTETHGVLYHLYPKSENIQLDLFWSSSFKMKLSLLWWLKAIFDDMLVIFILYCFSIIALKYSMKMYLIAVIYMIYHMADLICFFYDYKQTWGIYIALIYCSSMAVILLIAPEKWEMKIVK